VRSEQGGVFVGELDDKAVSAASNDRLLEDFIFQHHAFILNCLYRITHCYISKSKDEWSIGLIAFSQAVKTYNSEKGAFLPYAELIIRRSLIDYYRSTHRFQSETPVDPLLFQCNPEEDDSEAALKSVISEKLSVKPEENLRYEIASANEEFQKFGFSFYDLSFCSPKSEKTKQACKTAVLFLLENTAIKHETLITRQLPIKILQKNTDLPRKLLERHRKYIIAAMLILSGEYPLLAEYLPFFRKDGN
jgi:RNA polymerase sigma factor